MKSDISSATKYSQKTLNDAIKWIKEQPDSIKNLVSNTNSLVTLYRQNLSFCKQNQLKTFQKNLKKLSKEVSLSLQTNSDET